MEEDNVTFIKEEIYSENEIADIIGLDALPVSDPLQNPNVFAYSEGSPLKGKAGFLELSYKPNRHHLDAICLNIRIAIIRCFYSSSSCSTTALRMLTEENNELSITVNVEDINFFVQKFEKTGSVVGNHKDHLNFEDEDCSTVETSVDDSLENFAETIDSNNGNLYATQLSTDYALENSQWPPQKAKSIGRKIKVPLCKKNKTDQIPIKENEKSLMLVKKESVTEKFDYPEHQSVKKKRRVQSLQYPILGKNQCRICKKKFSGNAPYMYHFLSHFNMTFLPKKGPFDCPGCLKRYPHRPSFRNHLFNRCRFKKFDFSQDSQISQSEQKISLYSSSCLLVDEKENSSLQSSSSFLDQVEQTVITKIENVSSMENSNEQGYKCPKCSKLLPNKSSLTYHISEHYDLDHLAGDPPYNCPGCDLPFLRKENLYKHLRVTCHKGLRRRATPFSCVLCNKAFQFEIQLEHHLLVHSGKAELRECHLCDKKFNTTSGFRYHLGSIHSDKKAYQCDQCPRYFSKTQELEDHKMFHLGTYLYTCETCGKKYETQKSYRAHVKRHKEKPEPWQCELCGRNYSGETSYKQHMRTHTQEIVAVCDLCGKGFNHKGNLRIHYASCQKHMVTVN